jgi:hypothetical protein
MKPNIQLILAGVVSLAVCPSIVTGQVLFSDNFDGNSTANWTLNAGAVNDTGNVFFNYSAVGIPSAPHSTGDTTIGMVLKANYPTPGVFAGISASPTGLNLSGNYIVTYDFWQNYNGNANGAGSGTTQLTGAGIGTSGAVAQHAGIATMSSLWFAQTGDGGNTAASKDYRVYSSAAGSATSGYTIASGVYAAGTGTTAADNLNALYAPLGANTVPAAQTALLATQTGTTPAGAPGFKWHTGQIMKTGNTVTYSIDGLLIATVDATSLTLSGGDIEFIQTDINATASTDANAATYEFGLFDNIVVQVPEPTTTALGLLGLAGFFIARRHRK